MSELRESIKNLKADLQAALDQIDEGAESKTTAYRRLTNEYPERFERYIRNGLAYFIPSDQRQDKMVLHWIFLFSTMVVIGLLFYPLVGEFMTAGLTFSTAFSAVILYLYIRILIDIYKWNGRYYKSIPIIAVLILAARLTQFRNFRDDPEYISLIIALLVVTILGLYLHRHFFPSYGFSGPKRDGSSGSLDDDGEFLFD